MYIRYRPIRAAIRPLKGLTIATLISLLTLSLALLPTASATAGPAPAVSVEPAIGSVQAGLALDVSQRQLEAIAKSLPTGDLGLSAAELEGLLKSLPALSGGLTPLQLLSLQTLLATLPSTTSVSGLLEGVLGVLHVHVTSVELLEALKATASNPTEVARIVSDLAGALTPAQLTTLQGILGDLVGNLSGENLQQLQGTVAGLLGALGTGKLTPILSSLEGVLSGAQLTQLQSLLGSLGSLTPTELQTKLGELLGGLESAQLGTVIGDLFGVLNPSQVHGVTEGLLGELPFAPETAGELAEGLGTSLEGLASTVGVEPEQLTGNVSTLTAPLAKTGKKLSLLNGLEGVDIGLLGGKGSGESGGGSSGSGGSGSSGSGGSGGSGGNGSDNSGGSGASPGSTSGTPVGTSGAGSTTVTLNVVGASVPQSAVGAPAAQVKAKRLAGVKVLSERVRGRVATLVVQVPTAGRLTVSGAGTRPVGRQVDRAERVTVRVRLARAGAASLHRHRGRLKVRLRVAFKPVSGATSAAGVGVKFV
jgi:hypothetical protein